MLLYGFAVLRRSSPELESHQRGHTYHTIIQEKTGEPLKITLHKIALAILENRKKKLADNKSGKVYNLASNDGCNKALQKWCTDAGIDKHITWHCARLSFSILLQDKNVDAATVAPSCLSVSYFLAGLS